MRNFHMVQDLYQDYVKFCDQVDRYTADIALQAIYPSFSDSSLPEMQAFVQRKRDFEVLANDYPLLSQRPVEYAAVMLYDQFLETFAAIKNRDAVKLDVDVTSVATPPPFPFDIHEVAQEEYREYEKLRQRYAILRQKFQECREDPKIQQFLQKERFYLQQTLQEQRYLDSLMTDHKVLSNRAVDNARLQELIDEFDRSLDIITRKSQTYMKEVALNFAEGAVYLGGIVSLVYLTRKLWE